MRPLLLRMHDTLIRQLLDNGERATGQAVERPTPMEWWMRAMNAVEARAVSGARA